MGETLSCCLDRDKYTGGKIRYIKYDQFENLSLENGYIALDCNVNSIGELFKAKEHYDSTRIKDAIFFDLQEYVTSADTKQKIDLSQEATEKRLKELKIGIETPVMCYDSSTGKFAARVACLLSSIGVKDVMILDGKYQCPKSETKLTVSKPPGGNVFSFKNQKDYFAKEEDIFKIIKEESKTQLVDVRSEQERSVGVIEKSKHIQLTNLIQNGELVNQKNILDAFKEAGINKDLPMIFYGGDDAYVLKAIADHAGLVPQTQVFQMSYEHWSNWRKNQELKIQMAKIQLDGAAAQQLNN